MSESRLLVAIGLVLAGLPLCLGGCAESQVPAMTTTPGGADSVAPSGPDAARLSQSAAADSHPASAAPETSPVSKPVPKTSTAPAIAAETVPAAADATTPVATADITFDDIKFPMEKGEPFQRSMLTDKVEELNGRPVRIRGYIFPSFESVLSQFVLVRDNLACCFGPGAALYDCIVVEMAPGKTANYTVRPVTVEGTFSISEIVGPDGEHVAIYNVVGQAVE